MSPDLKVTFFALLNSALITAGMACQKMNGLRGGNPMYGKWIIAAFLCLAPTFFIGNIAMASGGRMALFAAVNGVTFLMVGAMSWIIFGEPLAPTQVLGLCVIVAGVALVALKPGTSPTSLADRSAIHALDAPPPH
jgi:drug/metabolite transporter (DMT)-like permease